MKIKGLNIFILILLVFSFSCERVLLEEFPYEKYLVVQGTLGPDGIKVYVQKLLKINDIDSVAFIDSARVILEANSGFRKELLSFGNGLYKDSTFQPNQNELYRLIVSYKDFPTAISQWISLPNPIRIKSIQWDTIWERSDYLFEDYCDSDYVENSKYQYTVEIEPDTAYYNIYIEDDETRIYNICFSLEESQTSIHFIIDTTLVSNDSVRLVFMSFDNTYANYFSDLDFNYITNSSGNINNGVGVFIGYNITKTKIPIK